LGTWANKRNEAYYIGSMAKLDTNLEFETFNEGDE
jgi:hypothetical protein